MTPRLRKRVRSRVYGDIPRTPRPPKLRRRPLHRERLAEPWQTFIGFRSHDRKQARRGPALAAAVGFAPHPSWESALCRELSEPFQAQSSGDSATVLANLNRAWRRPVVIEALATLGSATSVEALITALASHEQSRYEHLILLALTRIGERAYFRARDMLESRRTGHVYGGSAVLGSLGLSEAEPYLLGALARAKTEPMQAGIASQLTRLPPSPTSMRAFQDTFEALVTAESASSEGYVLAGLARESARFFEPKLVPWLLAQCARVRGNHSHDDAVRRDLLETAMRLALPRQWPRVSQAVKRRGDPRLREQLEACSRLLERCRDDVASYVQALSAFRGEHATIEAKKAASMVGIFGSEETPEDHAFELTEIEHAEIVTLLAEAFDYLLPEGAVVTVQTLHAAVEDRKLDASFADDERVYALRHLLYRLMARRPDDFKIAHV